MLPSLCRIAHTSLMHLLFIVFILMPRISWLHWLFVFFIGIAAGRFRPKKFLPRFKWIGADPAGAGIRGKSGGTHLGGLCKLHMGTGASREIDGPVVLVYAMGTIQ